MPFVIGILLAFGTAVFARNAGLDRDRAFYPTVLIVVASYYVLFAAMGGSTNALLLESMLMAGFGVLAVWGFKSSPWILVAALFGHGVMDGVHAHLIDNAGVPAWWPAFCSSYDIAAAGCLAVFARLPIDSVERRGALAQLAASVRR